MIMKSFIKINNLISDEMINNKFYYFIKNKNKNGKFKLYLKVNLIKVNKKKLFLKHFYLIKYLQTCQKTQN